MTTTPTEEELYNVSLAANSPRDTLTEQRLSPDLRRKVDEIRRQREGADNAVKEQLAVSPFLCLAACADHYTST